MQYKNINFSLDYLDLMTNVLNGSCCYIKKYCNHWDRIKTDRKGFCKEQREECCWRFQKGQMFDDKISWSLAVFLGNKERSSFSPVITFESHVCWMCLWSKSFYTLYTWSAIRVGQPTLYGYYNFFFLIPCAGSLWSAGPSSSDNIGHNSN